MAWTTPGTAVAGQVLTASRWNSDVRDNTNDLRSYQNRYARAKRTSGNLTLTSDTWANVDTGLDLVLNASTGDVIEYSLSGLWNSGGSTFAVLDVVTIVSGSPVNSFGYDGTPANPATSWGVAAWYATSGVVTPSAGNVYRTLVAGDISSSTVTLRLRYALGAAATSRALNATAAYPLEVWARNHGPVTT